MIKPLQTLSPATTDFTDTNISESHSRQFQKVKILILIITSTILACLMILFRPFTITIVPKVNNASRAACMQFHENCYKIQTSIYDAQNNGIHLRNENVPHFRMTGYHNAATGKQITPKDLTFLWKNTEITANYVPETSRISLSDNGTVIQTICHTYGENTVLPADGLTPDKHPYEKFTGWKDAKGNIIQNVPVTSDVNESFTASWTGKTYKIAYSLDGGTASNPSSYTYHKGISQLNNASRNGYIFDGWYTDAAHTNHVVSVPKDSHKNLTLYAAFHIKPQPVPAHVQTQKQTSSYTPAPASKTAPAHPASYSANNELNWNAVANGEQADVDRGNLIQYDEYQNYYAAHAWTNYGHAIKGMHAGSTATVNGRKIVIDGEFTDVRKGPMDEVLNRLPNGEATPAFQTCIDGSHVVVKYGHYVN